MGFHHTNTKVRPLDEELKELGLDPEKTQAEIARQTGMVMSGPSPLDPSGLREGTELPRTLAEYGQSLLDEAQKPLASKATSLVEFLGAEGEVIPMAKLDEAIGKLSAKGDLTESERHLSEAFQLVKRLAGQTEGVGLDAVQDAVALMEAGWVPLTEQELQEISFIMTKLRKGAEAIRAKLQRRREYKQKRGTELRQGKVYRVRNKRQIMRTALAKIAKFGKAGLARLHTMHKRVMAKLGGKAKSEWSEKLANLREEITGNAAPQVQEAVLPIHSEAVHNAAILARYLGEVFDALGDAAGVELFKLSDLAVEMAKDLEKVESLSEEQTGKVEKLMEAIISAMKEYHELGEPSLSDAIVIRMVAEGTVTEEEGVSLMEYVPPPPSAFQKKRDAGKTSGKESVDPSVALKYLRKINEAMQGKEPKRDDAIKVANEVAQKYPAKDHKGESIEKVEDMKGVFRTMFYLSNVAGIKAPAWMYPPGKEPWKNEVPQALIDALKGLKADKGAEAAA